MNRAAGRCFRLDRVAGLQAAHIIPQTGSAPEQDRRDRDMQAVDETRFEKVAYQMGADPHILATGSGNSVPERRQLSC